MMRAPIDDDFAGTLERVTDAEMLSILCTTFCDPDASESLKATIFVTACRRVRARQDMTAAIREANAQGVLHDAPAMTQ